MNGNFGTVKSVVILAVLLVSIFTVFMPSTSAGILDRLAEAYTFYSKVKIEYDVDAAMDPVLPLEMVKDISVIISLRVTGYFAEELLHHYEGTNLFIDIDVNETPEWCTASILPRKLIIPASANWSTNNATLSVMITEDAPAFSEELIKVKVKVKGMSTIQGGEFFQDIRFIPGYLPVLRLNVPESSCKLVGPDDVANFDIEIENLGNAMTEVTCRIIDVPDGWTASIDSSATIGSRTSGDNTKRTLQLSVKPPHGFGHHEEREIIEVSITPSYFGNSSLTGEEHLLYFVVQSRGFYTPGFETIFVFFALIGVVLIFKNRQRRKETCEMQKRRGEGK